MAERAIVADFVNPPVPSRQFDWCAFYEGDEEKGEYGWGVTREAAIADLLENYGQDGSTVTMGSVCYRQGRLTVEDYDEAIQDLQLARAQLIGGEVTNCAVCEDGDHTSESCHHNPLVLARRWARATRVTCCYHCGYIAYTDEEAKAHFGSSETEVARCLVAKAPDLWKMVPAYPTNSWITDLDKVLVAKFGESPGGQMIAESITLVLTTAPAPPEEPLGENETASQPRAIL